MPRCGRISLPDRPGTEILEGRWKLTEVDDRIYQVVKIILKQCREEGLLPELAEWLHTPEFEEWTREVESNPGSGFETLKKGAVPGLRLSNETSSSSETLDSILGSGFETLDQGRVPVLRLVKVLMV